MKNINGMGPVNPPLRKAVIFTERDMGKLGHFLNRKMGLKPDFIFNSAVYDPAKKLASQWAMRAGNDDIEGYIRALNDPKEFQQLIEAVTLSETFFFRSNAQMLVMLELLRGMDPSKEVNILSAACATGEEPYSMAMLIKNDPDLKRRKVNIFAFDIAALDSGTNIS